MSSCACVTVAWDEDAEFHTSRTQRSRVLRKCSECAGAINPGDEYERVFCVWDGAKYTYRTCAACMEIRDTLMCSWIYTAMWEDLQEAFSYQNSIPWSDIGSLSKEARDTVCDWIERIIWDDEEVGDE